MLIINGTIFGNKRYFILNRKHMILRKTRMIGKRWLSTIWSPKLENRYSMTIFIKIVKTKEEISNWREIIYDLNAKTDVFLFLGRIAILLCKIFFPCFFPQGGVTSCDNPTSHHLPSILFTFFFQIHMWLPWSQVRSLHRWKILQQAAKNMLSFY